MLFAPQKVCLFCLAVTCSFAGMPSTATAGWLCDWLMGRQTAYYAPTYLAPTYAAPTTVAPTAYYAPATAYYAPTVSPVAGSVSSFYGTGNIYPSFPGTAAVAPVNYGVLPVSGYSPIASPTTSYYPPTSFPTTAYYPSSSYAAPVYTTTGYAYPTVPTYQPGGLFDGLRRMFRPTWNWGSGYTTRYYPAQVTYYSPVTSYSPATGVPVTSLSPCTSYQPQLQRLPVSSYLPTTVAPPQSNCGNPTGYYSPAAPSYNTFPQGTTGVYPPSGTANDLAPVGQPVLPPTNVQSPSTSLYPNSTLPSYAPSLGMSATSSSSVTPLPDSGSGVGFGKEGSTGAVVKEFGLQPIPALSLPSWYDNSSRQETTEDTRNFKTIQWRKPSVALPVKQPAAPAKPPFVKFDDSGWK
jgi:hypothetical protein